MKKIFRLNIPCLLCLGFLACLTPGPPVAGNGPEESPSPPPEKSPAPLTPTLTATTSPTPDPTPTSKAEPTPEPKFEVTRALYDRTYDEIDHLIQELNRVITNRNFAAWQGYLTTAYIAEKADPVYLAELSALPALAAKNIVLKDIEDYFFFVIIPSRMKAELEKIVFLDNNHVKAYGRIFNRSGILYYLEKINGQWKVGTM